MAVSLILENVGFTQQFMIVSGAQAVSLVGAGVAWHCPHNIFLLSMVSAGSGVVQYTQSAGDFQTTGTFTARLLVSYSPTARYFTEKFDVVLVRGG